MGRSKLSDWQDGDTKPTAVGVYQREEDNGDVSYCYWHGHYWNINCHSKAEALEDKDHPFRSYHQSFPWRGKL